MAESFREEDPTHPSSGLLQWILVSTPGALFARRGGALRCRDGSSPLARIRGSAMEAMAVPYLDCPSPTRWSICDSRVTVAHIKSAAAAFRADFTIRKCRDRSYDQIYWWIYRFDLVRFTLGILVGGFRRSPDVRAVAARESQCAGKRHQAQAAGSQAGLFGSGFGPIYHPFLPLPAP